MVEQSGHKKRAGNDLLSHRVPPAVPSALEGLTTVFGMGTGVAPPVWSPAHISKSGCSDSLGPNPSLKPSGQADRPISTARLNVLPRLHLRPIHLVVSEGPDGDT